VATDTSTSHDPTADLVRIGIVHAVAVAVPVLVIALIVVPPWLAPLIAIAVGVAVTVLRCRGIDDRVGASVGARAVDAADVPRLAGVVESTSMATGAATPHLHLIDDPGCNAVVWSAGTGPASLAVTTGLLEQADRIELEAVVAHLLTDVRDGVVEAPTVTSALFGRLGTGPLAGPVAALTRAAVDDRRVAWADLESARATQYPPGSVAALERIRDAGSTVARCPRALQSLWFAAPCEPVEGDPFVVHPPLADRIDLLREL